MQDRQQKVTIMSSPSPICLESQFKQRIPYIKSVIQSTLGVAVSTSNSYDILAISQGFSDYQSVEELADMPYYEWGLNIGTAQSPYFIMKAIGHHRNAEEARSAGESLLSGSPDHVTWILFENGQATTISFQANNDVLSWDFRNVSEKY